MQSTMYNPRTSRNLYRQRSLSSLPSRQLSAVDIVQRRQSTILANSKKKQEEQMINMGKDGEISKLRKNLETAVSTALNQRLSHSKIREEIVGHTHLNQYLQNKIKTFQKENKTLRELLEEEHALNQKLGSDLEVSTDRCKDLQCSLREKIGELEEVEVLKGEVERCKVQLKDIQPLKSRIKHLEEENRNERIKKKEAEARLLVAQGQKEELKVELSKTKPREQELRERVAYFERVNLDLERKMDDFNRRENEYIKNITNLKFNLTKMTADRNHYKTVYEDVRDKLEAKISQLNQVSNQLCHKVEKIERLTAELQSEKDLTKMLKSQLEGKMDYYKIQGEENVRLKERNKILQSIELELRRVIEGYVRISEEVNITIVQRTEEVKRLKISLETYQAQINEVELKFNKFDKLFEEGSEKSYNQVREGYYGILRVNTDLETKLKEVQTEFNQKFMILGEERDIMARNQTHRSVDPPDDTNQFHSIFHQKTEAIILLQNSNDQLLKVKKDLEAKIEELYGEIEKEKKQMVVLKLKTAEMFRAKKDLEAARKKMDRYQEMIQEQNEVAADLQGQMSILRTKNSQLNERHFVIELQKKNLEVQVQEMKEVVKELDVGVLEKNKKINEKNAHLIQDSVQKIESAIKSLSFYFNCAFCGELPISPITLVLCGHTYCTKCKEAYAESCYECDTGLPIEKVFQNRFLKDASGKYKFLTMVLKELTVNFIHKD